MAIERKTYIFSVPDKQQDYAKKLSIYAGKIYSKAVSLNWERYQKGSSISNETIATYIDTFYLKKRVPNAFSKSTSYLSTIF